MFKSMDKSVKGSYGFRKIYIFLLISLLFIPTDIYFVQESKALSAVFATVETTPVLHPPDSADDSAIWIHPTNPSLSTIIGTDKGGYLEVYSLSGAVLQRIPFQTNNVDLRYNFPLGGQRVALVTGVDRTAHKLFAYKVNTATRLLEDVSTPGSISGLWGSSMYVSPITGRYYAFINRDCVLNQYELTDNGSGKVAVNLVRTVTFSNQCNSSARLSEGVTADDVHAKVYVSEEVVGIWKLGAEPTDGSAKVMVDKPIAQGGHFQPDIEGLAIYYKSNGTGYLIGSSQGNSSFIVYTREGNNTYLGTFNIGDGSIDGVNGTDGIDVTNFPLGPNFPNGVFIAQDGGNTDGTIAKNQNFKLVPFQSIAAALNLTMDTSWDPRLVGASSPPPPPAVTISGTLGAASVTMSYTNGTPKTVISSANGSYSLSVPYNWSGTVTPSHACFTFNPTNYNYTNVTTNQTAKNYNTNFNPASGCIDVDVLIAGNNVGNYAMLPGKGAFGRHGLNGGPVHVISANGSTPIFTSQRAIYGSSFNSIVGYPGNQLTTDYWFTSYDDTGMTTFLVIGNPHPSQTAQVDVYISGVKMNASPYSIAPGQRIFPRYGINGGPVHVVSTNGVNIFTSERTKFGNSFNEVMGYPGNQIHTAFWFTSYDDAGMITYLVIGNPDPALMAEVDVYIGGMKQNATPYQIAPGQRIFQRYGVNAGPVHVVSTNGVNIFTSERTKFGDTFNEVTGYPGNQLTTDWWFTSYDDVGMITYLVIGNPHETLTAEVNVYIGGVKQNSTPYSIAPGQRIFQRYGVNAGPVHVDGINGVNIFASERSKYMNSFNEIMGLANSQLTTDYWFTSYDDLGMTAYLIIATP